MDDSPRVRELRLVVTAPDHDEALRFYHDALGLTERAAYASPGRRETIIEAGRATLELTDPGHAAFIDEVEVGRRVAGHIRVALEVDDSRAVTEALGAAGAAVIAGPTITPWNSLNSRLEAPAGLQLTPFTELGTPSDREGRAQTSILTTPFVVEVNRGSGGRTHPASPPRTSRSGP